MDTEKVKEEIAESKKYQELPSELKDLRDKINRHGKLLYAEKFYVGKCCFSVQVVLLDRKIYAVKRANRHCIEIVDINKKVKEYLKETKNIKCENKVES